MNAGIRLALALLLAPLSAHAQTFLEQFSYEGLRFSGIGVELGRVGSNRLTTSTSGALRVDYGFFGPRIRVLLGASYFRGEFKAEEIGRFENRLRAVVMDPSDDFSISVGRISLSNFVGDLDLQYVVPANEWITTYTGVGIALHVRDGSGVLINGTFVEDALDTITAGLNLSAGAEFYVIRRFGLTVGFRGAITSELTTVSAHGGILYRIALEETQ